MLLVVEGLLEAVINTGEPWGHYGNQWHEKVQCWVNLADSSAKAHSLFFFFNLICHFTIARIFTSF